MASVSLNFGNSVNNESNHLFLLLYGVSNMFS